MSERFLGALSVYLAAVLWSTIGVAATVAYRAGAGPFEASFLRVLFTVPFALLYFVVRRRLHVLVSRGVITTSFAIVAPFYVSYLAAVEAIGVGLAAVLLYTAPIWVYAYAVARGREELDLPGLAAVALAFAGVVLVTTWAYTFSATGLLVGLLSGLLYAALILRVEGLLAGHRGVLGEIDLALALQAYAAPVLAAALAAGLGDWGALASPLVLLSGMYLALVTGVAAYYLFYWGLRRVGSVYASIAATVEPLAAVAWGVLLFGEEAGVRKILGAVMVIASQVVLALRGLASRRVSS